jgi:hypothetical protein
VFNNDNVNPAFPYSVPVNARSYGLTRPYYLQEENESFTLFHPRDYYRHASIYIGSGETADYVEDIRVPLTFSWKHLRIDETESEDPDTQEWLDAYHCLRQLQEDTDRECRTLIEEYEELKRRNFGEIRDSAVVTVEQLD